MQAKDPFLTSFSKLLVVFAFSCVRAHVRYVCLCWTDDRVVVGGSISKRLGWIWVCSPWAHPILWVTFGSSVYWVTSQEAYQLSTSLGVFCLKRACAGLTSGLLCVQVQLFAYEVVQLNSEISTSGKSLPDTHCPAWSGGLQGREGHC